MLDPVLEYQLYLGLTENLKSNLMGKSPSHQCAPSKESGIVLALNRLNFLDTAPTNSSTHISISERGTPFTSIARQSMLRCHRGNPGIPTIL